MTETRSSSPAEAANVGSVVDWDVYLILQELTVMNGVFAVRPDFVRNLPGFFEQAIVYAGSCEGAANSSLADAFFERGASAFFGYDDIVHTPFAGTRRPALHGAGRRPRPHGRGLRDHRRRRGPDRADAASSTSAPRTSRYSPDLRNGGFECGTLAGWERDGDGRVIQKLGAFAPPAGEFMGIISTGLGFTTASGAIEQGFCLDPAAATLRFDWNFSSEELIEYCHRRSTIPSWWSSSRIPAR